MGAADKRPGGFDLVFSGLALVLGGGSLFFFGAFLYRGPLALVSLGLDGAALLAFDAALCLLFFLQHSLMVRKGFRRRLERVAPAAYHGVLYAIASGIALAVLVLLWQPSDVMLLSVSGVFAGALRGLWVCAMLVVGWGWLALGGFDPFGIAPLRDARREAVRPPLVVRGPYRWARHPLYAAFLVMTWAIPVLTADRLLFNLLWTGWIFLGTVLEERDLVAAMGEDYRGYQRRVPMLIPWRGPARDQNGAK